GGPHALTGHRVVRGVVAAHHLAAVRARVHHPRGLQVLLDEVHQVRRVEGAVVADEDQALVAGRRQRGRRPRVVDADHGLARLTRLGGRHLAGDLRRRARDLAGYLADRRLVERVLADGGGLPQDVPLAGRGGGRGAWRGRAAGRAAPALGQVDDQEHDCRHADHGRGQVQDHPHPAGPLRGPHCGARARAGPGAAARCGETVVAESGRGRRLEARLAVTLLAVTLLFVTALAVGVLPVGVLPVAVLGVAVLVIAVLVIAVLVIAVLRVRVLAEAVLPEAAVTEGVLLVVGGFGVLLRVHLGLVVVVGPTLAAEAARRSAAGRNAAGTSRRRVTLLAEILVAEVLAVALASGTLAGGALLAEVLLRVTRLGRRPVARLVAVACLVAVARLAGVARLLTRVRPPRTGWLFVAVTAVRAGAAVAVADGAVRTRSRRSLRDLRARAERAPGAGVERTPRSGAERILRGRAERTLRTRRLRAE